MAEQISSTIGVPPPAPETEEAPPRRATRVNRGMGHYVGRALGDAAQYLREHDPEAMMRDLERAARRRPMVALVSAVILGFTVGRGLRR